MMPVPLRPPDADVPLALASALCAIDDEAFYNLSIDDREPPPKPVLTDDEAAWLAALLAPLSTEA